MIGSAREQVVVHDLLVVHECPDANLGFDFLEPLSSLLAEKLVLTGFTKRPSSLLRQHPAPGHLGVVLTREPALQGLALPALPRPLVVSDVIAKGALAG
jgi:hypothetical protein